MLLEYFQMIDRVEHVDLASGTLRAASTTPTESPVFEGHFPDLPLVPGVLLIETMAQASGFLMLAKNGFTAMPFLMSVDSAKLRSFVGPDTALTVEATLEHDGSGYAVTRARLVSGGKKICDAQLKLRTVPFAAGDGFDTGHLAGLVRARADEVGLMAALSEGA